MFTVGLTGGIGCGKSVVADEFEALGAVIVDADRISHELTGPGGAAIEAIAAQFGAGMLTRDGALDRRAMRERVFAESAARRDLEAILHPLIRHECAARLAAAHGPYALLVVPLLIETGHYRSLCDRIAVVDCPESVQIERVIARNGLSEAAVRAVIAAQASRAARLAAANDVIENGGSLATLKQQLPPLDALYRRLAGTQVGTGARSLL
ncbi:dephospho-CoA kinase [Niveibacterium terrae]|uniref:dephospho-CoA kinase n=1 Tax=Niveibacterium terrae TaxID=3373598 RepID=UPI003A8F87E9